MKKTDIIKRPEGPVSSNFCEYLFYFLGLLEFYSLLSVSFNNESFSVHSILASIRLTQKTLDKQKQLASHNLAATLPQSSSTWQIFTAFNKAWNKSRALAISFTSIFQHAVHPSSGFQQITGLNNSYCSWVMPLWCSLVWCSLVLNKEQNPPLLILRPSIHPSYTTYPVGCLSGGL